MMKSQNRSVRKSSIILTAVVLLIAVIGFFLWQNTSIQSDNNSAPSTAPEAQTDKITSMKTTSFGDSFGETLQIAYPETWALKKVVEGQVPADEIAITTENITLTSANGKYIDTFIITNGGIGGACNPESTGTIQSVTYQALANREEVYFVNAISTANSGKYINDAGLYATSEYFDPSQLKVGDSSCKLGINPPIVNDSVRIVSAFIKNTADPDDGYSTFDEAKAAYSGIEFEEAKAIYLSLK